MSTHVELETLPVQQILPMWFQHEIDSFLVQQQRRLLSRVNRALKRRPTIRVSPETHRTKLLNAFDVHRLDSPFGSVEDTELSYFGESLFGNDSDEPDQPPPVMADPVDVESRADEQWSDAGIAQLHESLVPYSLRLLNARGNGSEKLELLRWIFDPDAVAVAELDPKGSVVTWKYIDPAEVPFCFELCCRYAGYDAERIREGLAPILKSLGLGALFKEVEDAKSFRQSCRADHARAQQA